MPLIEQSLIKTSLGSFDLLLKFTIYFEKIQIYWIVKKQYRELLEYNPAINTIIEERKKGKSYFYYFQL